MFKFLTPALLSCALIFTSCASMNTAQERELKEWRAKSLEVKEKNTTTAAVLNVLPGIGDFYNGNPGYGVANLLTWPLSILWAPIGGVSGAEERNYFATKAYVEELEVKRKKLKNEVETAFIGNQISKQEFMLANKKIDAMELSDFQKRVEAADVLPKNYDLREPSSAKN